MSAFVFKTLRWVITRRINKAQGGHGDAQLMNCVAKDPEARALPLGERRVGGKLGYVTNSAFSSKQSVPDQFFSGMGLSGLGCYNAGFGTRNSGFYLRDVFPTTPHSFLSKVSFGSGQGCFILIDLRSDLLAVHTSDELSWLDAIAFIHYNCAICPDSLGLRLILRRG
jgi:hypothetical protein